MVGSTTLSSIIRGAFGIRKPGWMYDEELKSAYRIYHRWVKVKR